MLAVASDYSCRESPAVSMRNIEMNRSGNPAPIPIFGPASLRERSHSAIFVFRLICAAKLYGLHSLPVDRMRSLWREGAA